MRGPTPYPHLAVSVPVGPGEPLRFPLLVDTHFIHRARLRALDVSGLGGVDAAVEVDLTDDNTNGVGGLQGGMIATLVDCAAGEAVRRRVEPGDGFGTQDLVLHFLAPVRRGPARATARVRRAGRRSVVVQLDVVDLGDDERLCAIATATFVVLPS